MVKFRYKVVMINIILLSLGIGVVGFFMIRKNFQLALDTQIRTAIEENNLLQSEDLLLSSRNIQNLLRSDQSHRSI